MCDDKAHGGRRCKSCAYGPKQRDYNREWMATNRRANWYGMTTEEIRGCDQDFLAGNVSQQVAMAAEIDDPLTFKAATQSKYDRVRAAALASPLADPKDVDAAVFDGTSDERRAALANPNISESTLARLRDEGTQSERRTAVELMHRRGFIGLNDLINDDDAKIRLVVANESNDPEHLSYLVNDRSSEVKIAAIRRGGPLPIRFATHRNPAVRLAAAESTVSPDVLARLSTDGDLAIAEAAKANPAFDPWFDPESAVRSVPVERAGKERGKRAAAERTIGRENPATVTVKQAYKVANDPQRVALSKKPAATSQMVAENFSSWDRSEQVTHAATARLTVDTSAGIAEVGAIIRTDDPVLLEAVVRNQSASDEVRRAALVRWNEIEGTTTSSLTEYDQPFDPTDAIFGL